MVKFDSRLSVSIWRCQRRHLPVWALLRINLHPDRDFFEIRFCRKICFRKYNFCHTCLFPLLSCLYFRLRPCWLSLHSPHRMFDKSQFHWREDRRGQDQNHHYNDSNCYGYFGLFCSNSQWRNQFWNGFRFFNEANCNHRYELTLKVWDGRV